MFTDFRLCKKKTKNSGNLTLYWISVKLIYCRIKFKSSFLKYSNYFFPISWIHGNFTNVDNKNILVTLTYTPDLIKDWQVTHGKNDSYCLINYQQVIWLWVLHFVLNTAIMSKKKDLNNFKLFWQADEFRTFLRG